MQKEELGIGYIIIGYLALPFIGLYNLIKLGAKDMTDGIAFIYYFFVLICAIQIIQILQLIF